MDSAGTVGPYPSVAVDSKKGVHIAYQDATPSAFKLKYAYKAAGAATWSVSVVQGPNASNMGDMTAIGVDSKGGVHIAYHQGDSAATHQVKAAYRAAGATSWTIVVVDTANVFDKVSQFIDSSDSVHLVYAPIFGASNGKSWLRYAVKPSGGTWTSATVDTSANSVGRYPSVTVDSIGAVHIAHYANGSHDLSPPDSMVERVQVVAPGLASARGCRVRRRSDR